MVLLLIDPITPLELFGPQKGSPASLMAACSNADTPRR